MKTFNFKICCLLKRMLNVRHATYTYLLPCFNLCLRWGLYFVKNYFYAKLRDAEAANEAACLTISDISTVAAALTPIHTPAGLLSVHLPSDISSATLLPWFGRGSVNKMKSAKCVCLVE